jgi:hypothetical protein
MTTGAGGPAATTTAGAPGNLVDQLSPVLVRQARLISVGGTHQMTLRLNPESLGPLQVHLALGDGGLSIDLTTANANTRRAIEAALPQLRGSLADAGIRLERLDVGLRDSGTPDQGRGFTGNGGQRGNGSGNGGASGREFTGQGNQRGPDFSDFLVDQDGQPFDLRVRSAGRDGGLVPGASSGVGRSAAGATGQSWIGYSGYRAYGALRSVMSRGFRSRG